MFLAITVVNLSTGTLLSPDKFKHFDYGILSNTNVYGLLNPLNYDLSKVPVYLYYSENDWLANVKVPTIMLLPILFLSILASVSSTSYFSIDQLPNNVLPIDKIPAIKELNDPQFFATVHTDASLTAVKNYFIEQLDLVKKYGYNGEVHEVITSDGYILELHRITGRNNFNNSCTRVQKPVAFVMHGLLCSSACFIVSGPEKGLAFVLADAGYDVWLGNARGNVYSRKHKLPTIRKELYWDFSWHEIGVYDLPAMIDYIVKTTGREKMFYLGHSQGTTVFFVMSTELPEYQHKIQAMFALAPVAYCGRMRNPIFQFLARFSDPLDELFKLIGIYEFAPTDEIMKQFQKMVCAEDAITQPLCANVLFLISGFDKDQFDTTLLPLILEHVPAGAATKQIMHYAQLIKSGSIITSEKFRQYDYSLITNLIKYGTFRPPKYDLRKIKVPVSLHYGANDWLAHVDDVDQLEKELGNPLGKFLVPHKKFNHLDFMWAKDVKELLYNKILNLMTFLTLNY
ncbi:Lipase 3 [Trachymyrmex zeteki]|uniref:Lipase 3 n=1 Tax=Mycetomoellerius zeteki TaxID=64791 RepID=A0A151X458_9HYME|nr:Lipase 3 [Trachymyrmex zeteki]